MFFSPLEQFSVISLLPLSIGGLDFSITNSAIYCVLTYACISLVSSSLFAAGGLVVPSRYQAAFEMVYDFVLSLAYEQLGKNAQPYVAIVLCTFIYILISNLLGLIPFSFANTSW